MGVLNIERCLKVKGLVYPVFDDALIFIQTDIS